jgi:tetratricopeptide (TPR) repeat protein
MTRWLSLLLVGLFLAVSPRPAHAEDPAMRAAKRHFEKGEKLFALGKFDEALDEYQKAYDAKPIPDFLFNIGQCYRNLEQYDQAIFSFKKYLKDVPDAPNKDAVEKLIGDLEDKQARGEGKKIVDHNPPPRRHHEAETPIYETWWFWTGVGVVVAAGSVGIYEGTKGGPPGTDLGNIVFGR